MCLWKLFVIRIFYEMIWIKLNFKFIFVVNLCFVWYNLLICWIVIIKKKIIKSVLYFVMKYNDINKIDGILFEDKLIKNEFCWS